MLDGGGAQLFHIVEDWRLLVLAMVLLQKKHLQVLLKLLEVKN